MLYTEILTFQATWVWFFSKNGFKRVLKDSVKIGDWEDIFTNIKIREENLKAWISSGETQGTRRTWRNKMTSIANELGR
jgi:hypothetical protein